MDQNATYAQVLEALKRADSPELGQLLGFRPWQYYAIEDDPRFIRLLEQPLPKVPTATLVEALQGWRVPYSVQDGAEMKTVARLSNWLTDRVPTTPDRRLCYVQPSTLNPEFMGLFAGENIPKGARICTYGGFYYPNQKAIETVLGVRIDDAPEEPRFAYIFESVDDRGKKYFVDGYRGFSLLEQGRWANTQAHLELCDATFVEPEGTTVALKARRPIPKDKEIFVWYSEDYAKHIFGADVVKRIKAEIAAEKKQEREQQLAEEEAAIPPTLIDEDKIHVIKGLRPVEVECGPDVVYRVPPQRKWIRKEVHKPQEVAYDFPALEIRQSTIPNGGCGLFAAQDIAPKDIITEYGGALIEFGIEKDEMVKSHLLYTAMATGMGERIDGRVFNNEPFRLRDYIERHEVMQFANSSKPKLGMNTANSDRRITSALIVDPLNKGKTRARVLLEATKPIKKGEEIFYKYDVHSQKIRHAYDEGE